MAKVTFRHIKGSPLTHAEMDVNLGLFYHSSSLEGNNLELYYSSSNGSDTMTIESHSIDLSGFLDDTNLVTSVNGNTGAVTVTEDQTVTIAGQNITVNGTYPNFQLTGSTQVSDTDSYISNITKNGGILTFTDGGDGNAFSGTINLNSLTGSLYYSSSINGNDITFFQGDGTNEIITVPGTDLTGTNIVSSSTQITTLGFISESAAVNTGSFYTSSSISGNTITFEQGDGTTESVVIPTAASEYVSNVTFSEGTLSFTGLGNAFNNTVDISDFKVTEAEKVVFDVQVSTGSGDLIKGTPVHIIENNNGSAIVVAASASDASTMPSHGILNQNVNSGQSGVATILGNITGVNTSGFSSGDTVYVGASGGYTNVKPTGSNLIQNLGVVKKVDASNGTGQIFGSGRSNDLPNIPQGKFWAGNSNGVPVALSTGSLSGSFLLNTTDTLNGDLTVTGNITAQEFHTEYVSSSIIYESGSTQFGDSSDDNHTFTGSLRVNGNILGDSLVKGNTAQFTGLGSSTTEKTSVMINVAGELKTRELGDRAFDNNTYDNYNYWLVSGSEGGLQISSQQELLLNGGVGINTSASLSGGGNNLNISIDFTEVTLGSGLDANGATGLNLDLTEVIANDGANKVLTSDGDGTLTAETVTISAGEITAANFITTSDKRLKSEIKPIAEGLETIKQFVSYEYLKNDKKEAGFIAQEVQQVIPYAVAEGDDGFLTMNDRPVLAHLHKAILELEERLSVLEKKIG